MDLRIGQGYDVHAFAADRPLILGGVAIPFDRGLAGHSDADVLTHAVCDALLGALAQGDIGQHFPDTDSSYKGADSLKLLQKCAEFVEEKGYKVRNVDCTVVAQRPKLAAFIPDMRSNLAGRMSVPVDDVSVKATTSEQLGFEGREEGIACSAIVLLIQR